MLSKFRKNSRLDCRRCTFSLVVSLPAIALPFDWPLDGSLSLVGAFDRFSRVEKAPIATFRDVDTDV